MKKKLSPLFVVVFIITLLSIVSWQNKKKEREFYQLVVYHFNTTAQEKTLDAYFQKALLPALHRTGMKTIGVFKSWANDTAADKLMYVWMPLRSPGKLVEIQEQLKKDQQYLLNASDYLNADPKTPPYVRMETILLHAFLLAPQMNLPLLRGPRRNRVYELRSYESATEMKFANKVKMFNEGDEIGLFRRLNFNAVFYSEVVAGSKMPNLMYMTSFENKADRDEHWKQFSNDSTWKRLSSMPEYKNNVSHIDISFLYPAEYSDF